MASFYHLDDLRTRLMAAKEKLALERLNILQLCPVKKCDNREAYGFAYLQAERACINAIKKRMTEIEWLPTKLDTSTEINGEMRSRMTRWIKQGDNIAPGEEIFGNAFVHALARCTMLTGKESAATRQQADRIGNLFRDLTCLVAAIHCSNICNDLHIEQVELKAPNNLTQTARDLTMTTEALLAMAEDNMEEEDDMPYPEGAADNQNRQTPPSYLRLVPDTAGHQPENPA